MQLALNNCLLQPRGNISPFFASHGYDVKPIAVSTNDKAADTSKFGRADATAEKLHSIHDWISSAVAANQQQTEDQSNRHRTAASHFRPGQAVWLDMRNVDTGRSNKKIDWLHGKYKVIREVEPMVYELDLPTGIHNHFHSDLLRSADNIPLLSQRVHDVPPPAITIDGKEEFEINEILCAQGDVSRVAWVKWKGYQTPTAMDVTNVADTEALDRWEAIYGSIQDNDGPKETYPTGAGRLKVK